MQVLLVEDEPAIADTVVYALESENITCHWVQSARAALEHLSTHHPTLILMDIGLPDQNGFDLFKAVQHIAPLPVIFLTSRHSEIDQVLGLELGADDYITKPFSPRLLSARVRAHLRRLESAQSTSTLERSGFIDDPQSVQISYDGHSLPLSRYEYGLLSTLMRQPWRVFSREQLMDAVWNNPEASFDRTVDTHIKTLRHKLLAAGITVDPIKTRRGVGYFFEYDRP